MLLKTGGRRNYLEVHAQSNMKFAMAAWPAKRLDETAIENPGFFKGRFGFETCVLMRIKVIAFQRKHDLLDSEIMRLKKSGFLKADRRGFRIDKGYAMPLLGWFQIAMMIAMVTLMLLTIAFSKTPEWKQALGYVLIGLIVAPALIWIARTCILPRRLLKECGALHDVASQSEKTGANPVA